MKRYWDTQMKLCTQSQTITREANLCLKPCRPGISIVFNFLSGSEKQI